MKYGFIPILLAVMMAACTSTDKAVTEEPEQDQTQETTVLHGSIGGTDTASEDRTSRPEGEAQKINEGTDQGTRVANPESSADGTVVSSRIAERTEEDCIKSGISLAMEGEYDKATDDFSEAIKMNPGNTHNYILRARATFAGVSDITKVEENFSGITYNSVNGQATDEQIEKYDLAIEDLTKALESNPYSWMPCFGSEEDAETYIRRGRVYTEKGDYNNAISDFSTAIEMDSGLVRAYNGRGNVYTDKGEYDKAIEDFSAAVKLIPDYAEGFNSRGYAYSLKGDTDKAIADYSEAIKYDSEFAVAYNNRGLSYIVKRDYARAIADFDKAIELNDQYVKAYNGRATAHAGRQDWDKAIEDYNKAIQIDPSFTRAYLGRGNAYSGKEDWDKAIADFTKTISLDSENVSAYNSRGIAYASKGDYRRAIADYTKAIDLDDGFAIAYNNRGVEYYGRRDYNNAIQDYEAALKIDQNNAVVKRNLDEAKKAQAR